MDAQESFFGKVAALTRPPMIFNALGAALAALYAALTLELPPASLTAFLGVAGVLGTAGLVVAELRFRRRVPSLAALARSEGPWPPQQLAEALREVAGIADFAFISSLQMWVGGTAVVAAGYAAVVSGAGWGVMVRILAIGLIFGPVAALLGHLLTLRQTRQLIESLGRAGLAPTRVLALIPAGRGQLRRRLGWMVALTVLMPSILAADVTLALSRRAIVQVVNAGDAEARRASADAARLKVALASLALLGLLAAFGGAAAFLGADAVADPLRRIAQNASQISTGTLSQPRLISAEDEIWTVSAAFTTMQAQLVSALRELRRAGVQIGSTTEEIVATSNRYEAGAADQASSLNQTSATTEELARSARQMAENATSVSDLARKTWEAAQGAQQSAAAFADAMTRMRQDNQAIAEAVTRLSDRVQQIGRIVEFINGVADKSDLLALSAELEGTKAGEVGRGFTLVAAEMRRLAENVLESTNEIEELIDEIRIATVATVEATEGGLRATEGSTGIGDALSQGLGKITTLAENTSAAVQAISVATQHQQQGTDQLAEAMSEIFRVTHQSLQATKQVTAANVDLAALAKELKGVVERFDVG